MRGTEESKLRPEEKAVALVFQLRGGARRWGEDSFLSPNRGSVRASREHAALARNSAARRHLGASSPSENARGGCRG